MTYEVLADPAQCGALRIPEFVSADEVRAVRDEIMDPTKVEWLDSHETYVNQRGVTIVQNHFAYALKLSAGDQAPLQTTPKMTAMYKRTERFVQSLAPTFPALESWEADELSLHLYDDQEVGLSTHRDNARFTGLIAILAIDGVCDLVITHNGERQPIQMNPGDLGLLRAPGLIDTDQEIRPEHSVENLQTATRISLMLRANNRPNEAIPGFKFNNWQPAD